MFSPNVGGVPKSNQASAAASHNNSGSALMAANAKMKRKQQTSPKGVPTGAGSLDSGPMKVPGSATSLKYAPGGMTS